MLFKKRKTVVLLGPANVPSHIFVPWVKQAKRSVASIEIGGSCLVTSHWLFLSIDIIAWAVFWCWEYVICCLLCDPHNTTLLQTQPSDWDHHYPPSTDSFLIKEMETEQQQQHLSPKKTRTLIPRLVTQHKGHRSDDYSPSPQTPVHMEGMYTVHLTPVNNGSRAKSRTRSWDRDSSPSPSSTHSSMMDNENYELESAPEQQESTEQPPTTTSTATTATAIQPPPPILEITKSSPRQTTTN